MSRPARRAAPLLAPLLMAGCAANGGNLLDPHGIVAQSQRGWLLIILLLMMIVVLPIFVMVPLFSWRYRRRGNGVYRPDWTFSWPLEYLVWGVPVVIVAALAVLIATRETALDPYHPLPGNEPPLQIDVVALDWKFLFIYPQQQVASVSMLAMPLGRQVSFHLTSDATMQSFFIPGLGSQIYMMAGMVTQLHLRADRPGTLEGENTQFNGDDFQNDKFRVDVMSADRFDRFVADCRAAGRTLDQTSYAMVARHDNTAQMKRDFVVPASADLLFGDVQPDLFPSLVRKYNPDMSAETMPAMSGASASAGSSARSD